MSSLTQLQLYCLLYSEENRTVSAQLHPHKKTGLKTLPATHRTF